MTATRFDPLQPLGLTEVENALVIPFGSDRSKGLRRPAGVLDAAGQPISQAICWRDSQTAVTTRPAALPAARTLSGTWLYGGMLYGHFGHFLCESTARLWALDHLDTPPQGVIFLPKPRLTRQRRLTDPVQPWLAAAGIHLPVDASATPTRVERLIVPEQGFGTGDMVAGRPEYRAWARAHFGATIAPEGGERLYISRSRLYSKRGRILGEAAFETLLAAQGYDIFHPQEHPIAVQIARYKAARQVISTDCSALHLAAFFAKASDRVAILARRPGPTIQDFVAQYAQFAGVCPVLIDSLTRMHHLSGAHLAQMSEVYAEVDYADLVSKLTAAGFLVNAADWTPPDRAALDAELAHWTAAQGAEMDAPD